ncbi:MAG: hypothetical protein QNL70_04925 [Pseudomonas sp.]
MNIKSYEQWLEDRLKGACALAEAEGDDNTPSSVDCAACDGTGEVECDCDCEHCEALVECHACEGEGTIPADDADSLEGNERLRATYQEYLRELVSDLSALSEWKGKPSAHCVIEAGLAPYMLLATDVETGHLKRGHKLMIHDPAGIMRDQPCPTALSF